MTTKATKPFKAVLGILDNTAEAERVVAALKTRGFRTNDISVLFPDNNGTRDFAHENNTKAPEGAVVGASAGGLLGGTLGVLAGVGLLAIPGLGPLIAAGPILAALSGLAAGGAVGGLAGGLVGLGIPEVEAKLYEGKLGTGNILLSVHVDDNDWRTKAKQLLEEYGAKDIAVVGEASVPRKERDGERPSVTAI